jgi:very-long-chain enoyl-CoA reductase
MSSVYITIHNMFHVAIHSCLLGCAVMCATNLHSPDTVFFGHSLTTLLRVTQTAMMSDVANSMLGVVRSSAVTTFLQILSRVGVAWLGDATHFQYLAIIWAISDITRYAYHVVPKSMGVFHQIVEWFRYNQYMVLYPAGVTFENISMLPAAPHVAMKAMIVAIYAIFFPRMFNHTAKLNKNRYITAVLRKYCVDVGVDDHNTNGSSHTHIKYKKTTYVYDHEGIICVRAALTDRRYNWKSTDETEPDVAVSNQLMLRDYGLQVSWRLVYIVEYAGALLTYPLMVWWGLGGVSGLGGVGGPITNITETLIMGTTLAQTLSRPDVLMWIAHYAKRILESVFIHSFSADTMPFENIFKNSLYYWGAGWVLGYMAPTHMMVGEVATHNMVVIGMWIACQLGNLFVHHYLANLRVAPDGSRITGHVLPTNQLFRIVVCPNYGFEVMGWACFAMLDVVAPHMVWYVVAKSVFCVIGATQMYVWAGGKRKRYRRLFGDKYKTKQRILPFM